MTDDERGDAAAVQAASCTPAEHTDERSDRRSTEGRTEGSEADTRNNLIGTENYRQFVYPFRGSTRHDAAATGRDRGGRFVARGEPERFDALVDKTGECWLWTGTLDRDGYGVFRVRRPTDWTYVRAHRWSYEHHHGFMPASLTLDHRCHTNDRRCPGGRVCPHRRCVRPDHLEIVTSAENTRRRHRRRRSTI